MSHGLNTQLLTRKLWSPHACLIRTITVQPAKFSLGTLLSFFSETSSSFISLYPMHQKKEANPNPRTQLINIQILGNKINPTPNTNEAYKSLKHTFINPQIALSKKKKKPTNSQIRTHGYKSHKHTYINPQIPKSKFHFINPQI